MHWDITYLRNGRLTHFFEDNDIFHPVFKLTGRSSEAVVSEVKEYIAELMMENCFSIEEGPDTLRVYDPTDGETIENFTNIKAQRLYRLIGPDSEEYLSRAPGTLGGHRKLKIYGRLDCPSALRYIAKDQYVQHRVFFADEDTAIAAGYRPCGICMKEAYRRWKQDQNAKGKL